MTLSAIKGQELLHLDAWVSVQAVRITRALSHLSSWYNFSPSYVISILDVVRFKLPFYFFYSRNNLQTVHLFLNSYFP